MSETPVTPTPSPTPPAPVNPQSAVTGPAYGLMAVGALFICNALYIILSMLFHFGLGAATGNLSFLSGMMQGVGGIFSILLNVAFGGFIIFGAMQMKNLKDYNMALAATIVAMIPCNYCCCIGIAVGIWSLVILLKPEVKAAFAKGGGPAASGPAAGV